MSRSGAPTGRPLRVLVVEDSEDDAALLVRELGRGGYEPALERVDTPEGMERALREADGRGEPFEVVISDYYMPRFRAPDALALLRGLGHDVPFIVISGKIGEDAAVGVLKGRPALDATASAGAGGRARDRERARRGDPGAVSGSYHSSGPGLANTPPRPIRM